MGSGSASADSPASGDASEASGAGSLSGAASGDVIGASGWARSASGGVVALSIGSGFGSDGGTARRMAGDGVVSDPPRGTLRCR